MSRYTAAFTHSFADRSIRLAHQFNLDEHLWHSLKERRRLRRKLLRLSSKQHKELDLRDYNSARPPDDCIGFNNYHERIQQ